MEPNIYEREVNYLSRDIKELASNVLQLDSSVDVQPQKSIMSNVAALNVILRRREELMDQCLSQFVESTVDINAEGMEQTIGALINDDIAGIDSSEHAFCVEFDAMVRSIKAHVEPQDDDMEVGVVEMNTDNRYKCPFTGMLFKEPLKSKGCGHTYSKKEIMNYLKGNQAAKCPVAGCRKNVSIDSLEQDDDMSWKMVNQYICCLRVVSVEHEVSHYLF